MNSELIFSNLLSPPILFFFAGALAALLKSDLEFPQPLPKLFSLYLLLAIGFKGGAAAAAQGLNLTLVFALTAAILLSILVPLYSYFILRLRFDVYNAAGVAAAYGSISAVTFITAISFLENAGLPYGGYMVTAMALMEAPAIIIAVYLAGRFGEKDETAPAEGGALHIVKDAFLNGSVFLLLASLAVGALARPSGAAALKPFTHEIFYGVLCLFLLDMGLVAARRLSALRAAGAFAVGFGLLAPLVNASVGIGFALILRALGGPEGFPIGNALLLTTLAASASYIAVPAALRLAMPRANPGLYVPMSLAITFPFNIILGIPLYYNVLLGLGFA